MDEQARDVTDDLAVAAERIRAARRRAARAHRRAALLHTQLAAVHLRLRRTASALDELEKARFFLKTAQQEWEKKAQTPTPGSARSSHCRPQG